MLQRPFDFSRQLIAIAAMACLVAAGWQDASWSQEEGAVAAPAYEVVEVGDNWKLAPDDPKASKATERKIKTAASDARKALANGPFDQAAFTSYYTTYFFPRMTRFDPVSLGSLANSRQDFLRRLQASRNPPAKGALNTLTLNEMSKLITGNFHPAVRYNAMLLVGALNAREGKSTNPAQEPLPLPQAMGIMLTALEQQNQHDAVIVGALVGVLRHVDLDRQLEALQGRTGIVDGATRQRIRAIAQGLVEQPPPPAGRSLAGHTWIRRRALEILASVPGPAGPWTTLSLGFLTAENGEVPLSLMCTAARVLERVPDPQGLSADPGQVAEQLGQFAAVAVRGELALVASRDKRQKQLGGYSGPAGAGGAAGGFGGGGGAGGGGGGGGGMPAGLSPFGGGGGGASPGGGGASPGGGLDPSGGGGPVTSGAVAGPSHLVRITQRRLTYQLYCAKVAIDRMYLLAGGTPPVKGRTVAADATPASQIPEAAQKIAQIRDQVDALMRALQDTASRGRRPRGTSAVEEPLTMEKLTDDLKLQLAALKKLLPNSGQEPEEPTAPGEEPTQPGAKPA